VQVREKEGLSVASTGLGAADGDPYSAQKLPWEKIARAELHETRLAILELLVRERRAVSPKELAASLGLGLPNVSYHVGCLHEAGLLRLARTEPRRGAVEHFYELVGE
jgi:DNA-binding transcriptional ArsR family regulator